MTEKPIPWRVIRAAPDLLKALEQAYSWILVNSEGDDGSEQVARDAYNALAKAKGEKE
jgi:hypothetical protein